MSLNDSDSPLVQLILTRLREFFREPAIVFWVFGFPLLMALGLGVAFRSKPEAVPVVAVVKVGDAKTGPSAELLASALTSSERIDATVQSDADAYRSLARARVDAVVRLTPEGVGYLFDPAQERGPIAKLVADSVVQMAAGRTDPLATREQFVTEVGARYVDFLIPGLIGLNLMGSSMWGIGYNLVVARKRKLLRRYAVTPMHRSQFLLSYLCSRLLFLVLEVTLLVGFGALLFGTRVQGSFFTLGLLCVLGAASFAGMSLLIGARLENTETANGWMNLMQLPMWVLSGAFFSYERFPEFLHLPIELLPLTATVNGLRAVYNDGAGLTDVGGPILVLAAWGLAGFLIALRTFRWQ